MLAGVPDCVFLVCLMVLHGVPDGVPGVPDGVPGVGSMPRRFRVLQVLAI